MSSAVARWTTLLGAGLAVAATLWTAPHEPPRVARAGLGAAAMRLVPLVEALACDDGVGDEIVLPTGAPTALGCDDARLVVIQARASLAAPAEPLDAAAFADATSDWLDPHGLWSVAPDAPVGPLVRRLAEPLLHEIEAPRGAGPCASAEAVGVELARWSTELRALFDRGFHEGSHGLPPPEMGAPGEGSTAPAKALPPGLWRRVSTSPFEDGEVTRDARELARTIGREVGAMRAAYGEPLAPFAAAARERTAPALDAQGWSNVVIAAALRAYIPQLDAHGAWAPLDEELSIYDLGLEADPPDRLWGEMTRTAIGVRIDRGALPPLADGDVILRVDETALAGVSVEQAQQFAVVPREAAVTVTVLREHAPGSFELKVVARRPDVAASAPPVGLASQLVRYADGAAVVIAIPDVPDDLGERIGVVLASARASGELRGVLLDVRANGGGSTDGAIAALGYFLPGVSLFPMRRRDGGVEVERAPEVAASLRWNGPVGVLVDGDSASAAEMIAGAIDAYQRGPIVGDRTYGKGCAQEYLDDDAHAGVLRLTTLLYALPDGSPVQKVGILPDLRLSLPAATEREATTERALGPWRGPDVRDRDRVRPVAWPSHGGHVGPCEDETVCRALRAIGASPAASR